MSSLLLCPPSARARHSHCLIPKWLISNNPFNSNMCARCKAVFECGLYTGLTVDIVADMQAFRSEGRPGNQDRAANLHFSHLWRGLEGKKTAAWCFPQNRKGALFPAVLQYWANAWSGWSKLPIQLPSPKINLILSPLLEGISDIKLIRTDTTLDLSQKAEKR